MSAAYDAIAVEYDAQVGGDEWMRRALHAHYARVFRPGDRVLDVGCGTGIDAVALARRGIEVVGIDGSAGMIAQLRAKVSAAGLAGRVQARVLPIEALGSLAPGERPFDGLIAAFASLNSLPDLDGFARAAATLVRPGGRMILHVLNRSSAWEWLGYARHRDWQRARQVGRVRTRRFVIGGTPVEHTLYFADQAYRQFFAHGFRRKAAYGLGAVRPPHTVQRLPRRLVAALEWLDVRSGGWPLLRDRGRFFVLDLERRVAEPERPEDHHRAGHA